MPDQLLLPADVEQAIITELSPFWPIATVIPDTKPSIFFRVVATGGSERDLVTDAPIVVLEAFAKRESQARDAINMALARLQLAARKGNLGGETCYGLAVAALPQNYPLPSVPTHKRYILTIAPALRRRAVTI